MQQTNMTRMALNSLQTQWIELSKQALDELEAGKSMLAFLEDPRYSSNLGYILARYLQRKYGTIEQQMCHIRIGSQSATFRLCDQDNVSGSILPEEERNHYAILLAALAQNRGMKAQFSLRFFQSVMHGQTTCLSRESCFKLTFAMHMDSDDGYQFLKSLGEAPYQFRIKQECVYYCCQSIPVLNHWHIAQKVLQQLDKAALQPNCTAHLGQTQHLEYELSLLGDSLSDFSNVDTCISETVDYLKCFLPLMSGESVSTHMLCVEQLDAVKELLGTKSDDDLAYAMWSPIWLQFCSKGREHTKKVGATPRYDFIPFRKLMHMPKTLYEKPLWRARIKGLRSGKLQPEKRDILFLALMQWYWSGRQCGGTDNMLQFLHETNTILAKTSLCPIYPPNQYDRMILLAVCNEEPLDVLSGIFEAGSFPYSEK